MIHFITGNPGGGKGLWTMHLIVEELVHGERPVVTNLPVHVEPWVRRWRAWGINHARLEIGLREYLVSKYGKDFGVRERLFLLEDSKVGEFYTYRRNGSGLFQVPVVLDKKGRVESFDTAPAIAAGGHYYVTDEAWKVWNSRKWQETGEGLLFFAAQHRHLGDTWLIVTQKTAQVDKALHRVAQDFTVVRNHGKLPFGMFNRPSIFDVSVYDEAPTGGKLSPMKVSPFRLDKKGLGGCYDTAAGSGIGGGSGADIGEKKKGIPWPFMLVLVLAAAVGIWKLPQVFGWLTQQGLRAAQGSSVPASAANTVASVGSGASALFQYTGSVSTNSVSTIAERPRVFMTGKALLNRTVYVFLSDGRVVDGPAIQSVNSQGAVIAGEFFPLALPLTNTGPHYVPYIPEAWDGRVVETKTPESVLHIFGRREPARGPVRMDYPEGVR